ncbi:uncharacterized protein ACA1_063350 [Acanthamoeba castellanii str. Neff]|jgi:hypothetical protein|uniref:Uncharacterized protein n=1 Tax=Acanthamoeba castellanii (strain ATCC 30010 / Neff) TaxID=1257118 RepID=L8GZP6_ACACF|nr:uncharacterized protein ACA1_063350 [Acanthamoeba castellanii str. Neff]ELR17571.1 hypothetical protein ACA1_063350 [Acanthamoeba castellanii str. Neff]
MQILRTEDQCLDFSKKNLLKLVVFVAYKEWTFTLAFETHPSQDFPCGTRGTFMAGGNGDDIEFYDPLSLDWEEHRLAEFQWLQFEPKASS